MEAARAKASLIERLAAVGVPLVCPACHGPVEDHRHELRCAPCGRAYPVIGGVADLRLHPDRFLSLEEDRDKGLRVLADALDPSYEAALEAYWRATPELAPSIARNHLLRQRQEARIGEQQWQDLKLRLQHIAPPILDVGCGLGGLVQAASAFGTPAIGMDAAFRWLLVAERRLHQAGSDAILLAANAEAPPFPPGAFGLVTIHDVLEHLVEPPATIHAAARLAGRGGLIDIASNNRYSLAPEPHVRLPGVGWLPRSWQRAYVRALRGHDYARVRLLSRGEVVQQTRAAGLEPISLGAAPTLSNHLPARSRKLARLADAFGPFSPRFRVTVKQR